MRDLEPPPEVGVGLKTGRMRAVKHLSSLSYASLDRATDCRSYLHLQQSSWPPSAAWRSLCCWSSSVGGCCAAETMAAQTRAAPGQQVGGGGLCRRREVSGTGQALQGMLTGSPQVDHCHLSTWCGIAETSAGCQLCRGRFEAICLLWLLRAGLAQAICLSQTWPGPSMPLYCSPCITLCACRHLLPSLQGALQNPCCGHQP